MKILLSGVFWGLLLFTVGAISMYKKELFEELAQRFKAQKIGKIAGIIHKWRFALIGIGLALAIPSFVMWHFFAAIALGVAAFIVDKKFLKKVKS